MLKLIPDDINVDFLGMRGKALGLSTTLVVLSLIAWLVMGLNLGIDFKGGSSVIVAFDAASKVDRGKLEDSMKSLLHDELGLKDSQVTVQDFDSGVVSETGGKATERFLVYSEVTSLLTAEKKQAIVDKVKATFGDKTIVDSPGEGTDIFYLTFPEDTQVTARYDGLKKMFKDLGYEHITVIADYERQLRVNCYEWISLLGSEQSGGAKSDAESELEDQLAGCEARIQSELQGDKKDRRFTVSVQELKSKVSAKLTADFGQAFEAVESSTSVSPSVGHDLLANGLLAVLYAIIGILIYITLRFDFRYAPGAVVALVHDVLITIGLFSVFQVKFSLPIIAALLTIVGYSLNDTIVVMDRVRETFDAYRGRDVKLLLNQAINSTLSRTVFTSLTTMFVVIAILVLGGGLIRDFALALFIGIFVGTYSSIFVASPLVYYMDGYLKTKEGKGKGHRKHAPKASPA